MAKSRRTSHVLPGQEWASAISELRHRSNLSQSVLGKKFHPSALAVSRWESGEHEPTAARRRGTGLRGGGKLIELVGSESLYPQRDAFFSRSGVHSRNGST